MLRAKVCLFVSLFCFLFYSSFGKDESIWPKEGALCPTDQVINATCSCDEKDDEEILSCSSNSENPSGTYFYFNILFLTNHLYYTIQCI